MKEFCMVWLVGLLRLLQWNLSYKTKRRFPFHCQTRLLQNAIYIYIYMQTQLFRTSILERFWRGSGEVPERFSKVKIIKKPLVFIGFSIGTIKKPLVFEGFLRNHVKIMFLHGRVENFKKKLRFRFRGVKVTSQNCDTFITNFLKIADLPSQITTFTSLGSRNWLRCWRAKVSKNLVFYNGFWLQTLKNQWFFKVLGFGKDVGYQNG